MIGQTDESKRFDVHDGMGITLAKAAGLKVGIITSRESDVVSRRASELKFDAVSQGAGRKTEILDKILQKFGIM